MTDASRTNGWPHAGALLIACLEAQGVTRAFCVPGESYLAALDALHDSAIDLVVARHEGAAAMMADADGKLTGRPGIAFVTRGPGATNASAGVHVAFQDSTPMVLFIGQVARDQRDREAFQEVDYRAMFAPLAKWVAEVEDAARLPEYVSRAFHVARAGRPGPVVLALPEDMLSGPADGAPLPAARLPLNGAAPEEVAAVMDRIAEAERPFLLVGGGGWSAQAAADLGRFAAAAQVPVGTSFRCQDYVDNDHPWYAGDVGIGIDPALRTRIEAADLLLILGARLGEMTTQGYAMPAPPRAAQALIHVHADPEEPGRVYRPDLALAARPDAVIAQLAEMARSPAMDRTNQSAALRADYEAWKRPGPGIGALRMEAVMTALNETLPADAILCNGAGNYSGWLHRYRRFGTFRSQLAPTSGSMGYGLPAAIAAKLRHPGRDVVCLAGDGCLQMAIAEMGTATACGAAIRLLVVDNGQYGTIRMHQEMRYPGRRSGTDMRGGAPGPDFAAIARGYGWEAWTVRSNDEIREAIAAMQAADGPVLLHLLVDPRAVSTTRIAE